MKHFSAGELLLAFVAALLVALAVLQAFTLFILPVVNLLLEVLF